MRADCPACAATYDVPDRLAGRKLRCAKCGQQWVLPGGAAPATIAPAAPPPAPRIAERWPEAAAAGPLPPAPPSPLPPPEPPAAQPVAAAAPPPESASARGRPDRGLLLAWVATVLVVGGLVAGVLLFPREVAEAWPPAGRLYAALGFQPSSFSTSPAR